MGDALVRLLLISAVIAVAAVLGYLARGKLAGHPPVSIDGFDLGPGLVVFTSTECVRCKQVIAAAKATEAPLREITYELEASLQERLRVTGVPLTLIIDRSGRLRSQFAGMVGEGRLRRALRRAGL
jgi:hypothetical protein